MLSPTTFRQEILSCGDASRSPRRCSASCWQLSTASQPQDSRGSDVDRTTWQEFPPGDMHLWFQPELLVSAAARIKRTMPPFVIGRNANACSMSARR
jgi:hypothetical protein